MLKVRVSACLVCCTYIHAYSTCDCTDQRSQAWLMLLSAELFMDGADAVHLEFQHAVSDAVSVTEVLLLLSYVGYSIKRLDLAPLLVDANHTPATAFNISPR